LTTCFAEILAGQHPMNAGREKPEKLEPAERPEWPGQSECPPFHLD
jgi:hypothetical protein